MKTIYIVRHAKSDRQINTRDDINRPLNERGYRDAMLMSALLLEKKEIPQILVTSPAVRAYSTALIFLKAFGMDAEKLFIEDGIYEASSLVLLSCIRELDRFSSGKIMIFGHNPGFTELANKLASQHIENIPTTGIVCVEFAADEWKKVQPGSGKMRFYEFPKKYRGEDAR